MCALSLYGEILLFYGRLEFLPEFSIRPPFRSPAEYDGARQSQILSDVAAPYSGELSAPEQWLQQPLWIP